MPPSTSIRGRAATPALHSAPEPRLSLTQARALQLAAMGLLTPPARRAGKADVLQAIRRMHVLQIDTINVVARSPYLVLWSRLGDYRPHWLDELLAEGALFEYWAHAACFLPIEDYPRYRRQMLHLEAAGFERSAERLASDPVAHLDLLDHVREHGPVRAAEFEHEDGRNGTGWWDWKPDKLRLETLFNAGEIMVRKRHNFQRLYDVRERVLPAQLLDDETVPDRASVARDWTLAAVRAMGIAPARWIGDYFRHAKRTADPHPDLLADAGQLLRVTVEGWPWPAYVHPDHAGLLASAIADGLEASHCTLLSPFDPLTWDRERALRMFGFDYRIECYTPEAKRRYGYFTLPLLVRGELVGRVDAKAHRTAGVFEVRALYLEPQVIPGEALAADVAAALTRCAAWHGTPRVTLSRTSPAGFRKMLSAALKSGSR
jgi:uncharacterized protein YcaQ